MSYSCAMLAEGFGFNEQGFKRTYTIPYQVISTTANDTNILAARNALNMPAKGTPFTYDSGSFLSSVGFSGIEFSGTETVFKFTAQYEPKDIQVPDDTENPLNAKPQISWRSKTYSVVLEKAYTATARRGNPTEPILNTAGMPYDPPLMRTKRNSLLNIQYNSKSWSSRWKKNYEGTINKNDMILAGSFIDARHAILNTIDASDNYDSEGNQYWTISIEIEVDWESAWQSEVLSTGFLAVSTAEGGGVFPIYTNGSGGFTTRDQVSDDDIKSKKCEPISEPARLDGNGFVIQPTYNSKYYQVFETFFAENWNALGIPTTTLGGNTSRQFGYSGGSLS